MDRSDRADVAIRISALLVLSAVALGLLVWYGTLSTGAAAVGRLLDVPAPAQVESASAPTRVLAAPTQLLADSTQFLTAPTQFLTGSTRIQAALASVDATISSGAGGRAAWEAHYMYAVSAAAGAWVLVRLRRDWRFDWRSLTLHPGVARGERDG